MEKPLPWTGGEVLSAAGGRLLGGDGEARFSGVCIDSRRLRPGELFVAIRGERLDGHLFLKDAVEKGAAGLLVAHDAARAAPCADASGAPVFRAAVADTTEALGQLAAHRRNTSSAAVAAITGSNGKTTTRAMTTAVAEVRFRALSTQGNFNNHIGLPLTLLALAPAHEWAVVELGMNAPGEIGRLARICRPDIGVITNIGPAHIGRLGSLERIRDAKAELLTGLSPKGRVALNVDDPLLMELAGKLDRPATLFGLGDAADVGAEAIESTEDQTTFTLRVQGERVPVHLAVTGRFMISNALAAAAAGALMGLSGAEIAAGLAAFRPVAGRMNLIRLGNGARLMDDTYNANPGSMKAALATLAQLKGAGRGFFAMGDMYELGDAAERLHAEVGAAAVAAGVSGLFAVGRFSGAVIEGARGAGMDPARMHEATHEAAGEGLAALLRPGDWALVKGSRAMAMERVVRYLIQHFATEEKEQEAI